MKHKRMQKGTVAILTALCLMFTACGTSASGEQEAVLQESAAEMTDSGTSFETAADDSSSQTELTERETAAETEEVDILPEEDAYAYSLIVSINPECELYYDASDVVVGIAYLNEDAKTAYLENEWIGLSLEESMTQLVTAAQEKGFMKEPAVRIELAKVSDAEAVQDSSMLDRAETVITQTLSGEARADWTARY